MLRDFANHAVAAEKPNLLPVMADDRGPRIADRRWN